MRSSELDSELDNNALDPSINPEALEPEIAAAEANKGSAPDSWETKYRDLNDQFLRLAADFDNFRKRSYQEHESARKVGREVTIQELLPVLDNLSRATGSLNESSDPKLLFQSFRLMQNQLLEAFGNLGVKKMQVVGQPFDPKFHEAVQQVDSDEHPDQTVLMEMQSGYMLYDQVLRPAMVSVSNRVSSDGQTKSSKNPFAQAASPLDTEA
jgi:molecular chaperone GrpE